jgi:hypothetical protein
MIVNGTPRRNRCRFGCVRAHGSDHGVVVQGLAASNYGAQIAEVLYVQIWSEGIEQDRCLAARVAERVRRSRRNHYQSAGRRVVAGIADREAGTAGHYVKALIVAAVSVLWWPVGVRSKGDLTDS